MTDILSGIPDQPHLGEDEGAMGIEIVDAGDAVAPEHLIVNCRDANDRQVSVS